MSWVLSKQRGGNRGQEEEVVPPSSSQLESSSRQKVTRSCNEHCTFSQILITDLTMMSMLVVARLRKSTMYSTMMFFWPSFPTKSHYFPILTNQKSRDHPIINFAPFPCANTCWATQVKKLMAQHASRFKRLMVIDHICTNIDGPNC